MVLTTMLTKTIVTKTTAGLFVAPICDTATAVLILAGRAALSSLTSLRVNDRLAGSCGVLVADHAMLRSMMSRLGLSVACGRLGRYVAMRGPDSAHVLSVATGSGSPRVSGGVTSALTGASTSFVKSGVRMAPPGIVRRNRIPAVRADPDAGGGILVKTLTNLVLSTNVVVLLALVSSAVGSRRSVRGCLNLAALTDVPSEGSCVAKGKPHGSDGAASGGGGGEEGGWVTVREIVLASSEGRSIFCRRTVGALHAGVRFDNMRAGDVILADYCPGRKGDSITFRLTMRVKGVKGEILVVSTSVHGSDCVGHCRVGRGAGKLSRCLDKRITLRRVVCSAGCHGLRVVFSNPCTPGPSRLLRRKHFNELVRRAEGICSCVLVSAPPVVDVDSTTVTTGRYSKTVLMVRDRTMDEESTVGTGRRLAGDKYGLLNTMLGGISVGGRGCCDGCGSCCCNGDGRR